ncbi:MAG: hypothetical protein JNN21_06040 [Candidatus Accumulibacter sp.]|nr:hypothetical protein [Accumulibacter sp.]
MSERQQDFRGDPQVSALYREHARDEPSAAGDERIIAAARAAVRAAQTVARRTWWQRWRTTLALATTLVLTLTLSLLHERQPADQRRETEVAPPRSAAPGVSPAGVARDLAAPASAPAAPEQAAPAAVAGEAVAGAGAVASRAAPRQPASEERRSRQSAAPTTGQSGLSPAAAGSPPQSDGPFVDRQGVAAVGSAPPVAKESNAAPAAAPAAPTVGGAEHEAAALGQAPAARKQARAVAKSSADDGRGADEWLEEIRALRREGRSVEAAQQLADFRRAHPEYPLPQEFRQ